MFTLFGVPLYGAVFVPLAVGVLTLLLFWMISSRKTKLPSSVASDELQKHEFNNSANVTEKSKKKKKKTCGSKNNCCSKKDGKSEGCSTQTKAIDAVSIFSDEHSDISQELAQVLSKQLSSANLPLGFINTSDSDVTILEKHTDGSLCIFLVDESVSNGHHQELHQTVVRLPTQPEALTGMNYTVFAVGSRGLSGGSKVDVGLDRWLHKSGAVRVCKAGAMNVSISSTKSVFDDWVEELLAQIQRWNAPKQKACKCGPKNKKPPSDMDQDASFNNSSSCSGSDEEDTIKETVSKPMLDLEDLAQILQK